MKIHKHLTHLASTLVVICSLLTSVAIYGQTLPYPEHFSDANTTDWTALGWELDGSDASVSGYNTFAYLTCNLIFDFSGLTEPPIFTFEYTNSAVSGLAVQVNINDGGWDDIATLQINPSEGPGLVDNTNTNYQAVVGASNVRFRFRALANNVASVDYINISDASIPTYDITYGYDLAGNRNSRTSVLHMSGFVVDEEEIAGLVKEIEMPLADINNETLFLDQLSQSDFAVFPNPTHQYVNVFTSLESGSYNLTLLDASGKTIQTRNLNSSQSQFDISRMLPGIYFIAIQSPSDRLIYKVIKE